jgi:hypothetical protein
VVDDVEDPLGLLELILFRNGELKSSLAGQWLPAAGGDGAWVTRTVSGPMLMYGDIFAASIVGVAGC